MNQQLEDYIKQARERGMTDGQISKSLTDIGWGEADVVSALGGGVTSASPIEPESRSTTPDNTAQNDARIEGMRVALEDLKNRVIKLESIMGKPEYFPSTKIPVPPEYRKDVPLREYYPEKEVQSPKPTNVESKITGKWFAGLGVLAILFGVSFFLKYAFENNLIGVTGRVVMGIVSGLVFLVGGDFLSSKDKYRQYSFFISGGGLALLYLSIYAAFNYYQLVDQATAFLFMIAITGGGAVLSLKSNAKVLACISILGGFLTQFLVSNGSGDQITLFSYVLILDLSFLGISYFKKWNEMYVLALVGTYLIFFSWYGQFYNSTFLFPTMAFLSVFFSVFLISPFFISISRLVKSKRDDLILSVVNGSVYFAASYTILKGENYTSLGFFFVAWAAVYLGYAYLVQTVNKEDTYAIYGLGGISLLLITLAVPIQLEKNWITIAWAIEGLILVWTGFKLNNYSIRFFGAGVSFVAALRLFAFDTFFSNDSLQTFIPVFNERFLTYIIVVASYFAIAYIYGIFKEIRSDKERNVPAIFGLLGNFFLIMILSLDLTRYYDRRIIELSTPPNGIFTGNVVYNYFGNPAVVSLRNAQNLTLSVLWGVYSGLLMLFGIIMRSKSSRLLAIIGLGIVIVKVFLYDASSLSDIYRIASFIFLGVILLVISFLFYKYKEKIKEFVLE